MLELYDAAGFWIDSLSLPGDADSVTLDLRQATLRLARGDCAAILLRHGHPSGRCEPSEADIAATRAVAALACLLGLRLHDHVVEAGSNRFSFRAAGML